ncbi:hypothetical protein Rai3103_15500 [Raineyella fluvialis]|uniref:Uncharacterized protein n=1 Tax=Raineyella fluvialis TaxID=2662261 RepID=A0A5Q2FCI7_9ACTN|nr:hypothetical protein Rai3103_15500 [Raineyella fluvialis]
MGLGPAGVAPRSHAGVGWGALWDSVCTVALMVVMAISAVVVGVVVVGVMAGYIS